MKGIGELFGLIKNRYAKEAYLRSIVKEIVSVQAKVELPIEKISFRNGKVLLKGLDQASKSSIFVKKQAILSGLKEKLPDTVINDVAVGS